MYSLLQLSNLCDEILNLTLLITKLVTDNQILVFLKQDSESFLGTYVLRVFWNHFLEFSLRNNLFESI